MLNLRPYQIEALENVRAALRETSRVLLCMPTGTGKTSVASHIIGETSRKGIFCAFLVHRRSLVEQTSRAFAKADISHAIIAGGASRQPDKLAQVVSVQSLISKNLFAPAPGGVLVVDEAHHAITDGYMRAIDWMQPRYVIGLSATPARQDGRGLGEVFGRMVTTHPVRWFIENGYLSPYRAFVGKSANVSGLALDNKTADYRTSDLEEANRKAAIVGDALESYTTHAMGRKTVVFVCSVNESIETAARFTAAGFPFEAVYGAMNKRDLEGVIARYATGKTLGLVSCDLISEGFDVPDIECAIMLRPTTSVALYIQQVGRALRTADGKTEAILLDHAGNIARDGIRNHGLPCEPRNWTLDAREKRESARPKREIHSRQCPVCFHNHPPEPQCPKCQYIYPAKMRKVQQRDGKLIQLTEAHLLRERASQRAEVRAAQTEAELWQIAKVRGYKRGWVLTQLRLLAARQSKR